MSTLRAALLQIESCGADVRANAAKGEAFCMRAAGMGADIALFPEMWSVGYTFFDPKVEGEREKWRSLAVGRDSEYVGRFRRLARELNMAIAVTYLEEWPQANDDRRPTTDDRSAHSTSPAQAGTCTPHSTFDMPRNTVSIIDRHGEIKLTYAKVHTCDFDIECELTPGDDFYVCKLDTAAGEVKVGAMICYDREFPESARVLMLKGAEIILVPNSCDLEINRLSQFRARAMENMVGMAMANYPGPCDFGHSIAFDGIAFTSPPDGSDGKSRDMLLVEAGEGEGIFIADFDLDRLREWRNKETWGNAFRRPRAYSILTSEVVEPPFVRPEARR